MRRAHKIDSNQPEIVEYLRDLGFSVLSLAGVGNGCPDLLVSDGRKTCLIEVKSDETGGKLRKTQEDFIDAWRGQVFVVRNRDDVDRYLT